MRETIQLLANLWRDRRGVTAMEYAVVAAGVIAVAATAFTSLGARLSNVINGILSGN